MSTPYTLLESRFARIADLDHARGILHWDMETMMPDGAATHRGEAMATLGVIRHEILTDPALGEAVAAAEADPDRAGVDGAPLDAWQRANLAEIGRVRRHATAVPADLVAAQTRAAAKCQHAWRDARARSDFEGLRPLLEEVLRLTREEAAAKAEALDLSPYDALLDQYEPGGRSARIDTLFEDLAAFLPDTIEAAIARQAAEPEPVALPGPFPVDVQERLGRELIGTVGFDRHHGRLDVSTHPFCGGADGDVRITTRYDEADFTSALMGMLHETGHALYEQGRPEPWLRQPVGAARGMTLHESQSLLIEMQAGRSRPFLRYLAPRAAAAFGGTGPAWTADNLYRLATRVARGFIRVDADEVTYPAHVILRYRLERAMLAGDLALADLPAAWDERMRELLGITPPDQARGCLQDIHWPSGAIGYFPTYTLGALAAAQLFAAAREAIGDLDDRLAAGDFGPLVAWLRRHVHARASATSTDRILEDATGAPLGTAVYKQHIRARYLDA